MLSGERGLWGKGDWFFRDSRAGEAKEKTERKGRKVLDGKLKKKKERGGFRLRNS